MDGYPLTWALSKNFGCQMQKFSTWKSLKHLMFFQRLIRHSSIFVYSFYQYANCNNLMHLVSLFTFNSILRERLKCIFSFFHKLSNVFKRIIFFERINLSISDHSETINANAMIIIIISAWRPMVEQKVWDYVRRCNSHNIYLPHDLHIIPIGCTNM